MSHLSLSVAVHQRNITAIQCFNFLYQVRETSFQKITCSAVERTAGWSFQVSRTDSEWAVLFKVLVWKWQLDLLKRVMQRAETHGARTLCSMPAAELMLHWPQKRASIAVLILLCFFSLRVAPQRSILTFLSKNWDQIKIICHNEHCLLHSLHSQRLGYIIPHLCMSVWIHLSAWHKKQMTQISLQSNNWCWIITSLKQLKKTQNVMLLEGCCRLIVLLRLARGTQ